MKILWHCNPEDCNEAFSRLEWVLDVQIKQAKYKLHIGLVLDPPHIVFHHTMLVSEDFLRHLNHLSSHFEMNSSNLWVKEASKAGADINFIDFQSNEAHINPRSPLEHRARAAHKRHWWKDEKEFNHPPPPPLSPKPQPYMACLHLPRRASK